MLWFHVNIKCTSVICSESRANIEFLHVYNNVPDGPLDHAAQTNHHEYVDVTIQTKYDNKDTLIRLLKKKVWSLIHLHAFSI
jgi:hypothetical protein